MAKEKVVEVKAFITVLGQTIVGKLVGTAGGNYELEGALFFGPQQDPDTGKVGMGYTPIALVAPGNPSDGLKFTLQKSHVVIPHDLSEQAIEAYNRVTGQIQVAPASAIVQLDDARKKR
jgi:hypothetical protein